MRTVKSSDLQEDDLIEFPNGTLLEICKSSMEEVMIKMGYNN